MSFQVVVEPDREDKRFKICMKLLQKDEFNYQLFQYLRQWGLNYQGEQSKSSNKKNIVWQATNALQSYIKEHNKGIASKNSDSYWRWKKCIFAIYPHLLEFMVQNPNIIETTEAMINSSTNKIGKKMRSNSKKLNNEQNQIKLYYNHNYINLIASHFDCKAKNVFKLNNETTMHFDLIPILFDINNVCKRSKSWLAEKSVSTAVNKSSAIDNEADEKVRFTISLKQNQCNQNNPSFRDFTWPTSEYCGNDEEVTSFSYYYGLVGFKTKQNADGAMENSNLDETESLLEKFVYEGCRNSHCLRKEPKRSILLNNRNSDIIFYCYYGSFRKRPTSAGNFYKAYSWESPSPKYDKIDTKVFVKARNLDKDFNSDANNIDCDWNDIRSAALSPKLTIEFNKTKHQLSFLDFQKFSEGEKKEGKHHSIDDDTDFRKHLSMYLKKDYRYYVLFVVNGCDCKASALEKDMEMAQVKRKREKYLKILRKCALVHDYNVIDPILCIITDYVITHSLRGMYYQFEYN